MSSKIPYTCRHCGTEFLDYASQKPVYCSWSCKTAARRTGPTLTTTACAACGKAFSHELSDKRKYCSDACTAAGLSKKVTHVCPQCGKEFKDAPCHERKFCSKTCGDAARRTGTTDHKGYRKVRAGDGRQVQEHRHVMEQVIGGPLPKGSVVHHVNGRRDDNRIENLQLLTSQGEHLALHCENFRSSTHKECSKCHAIKPRSEFAPRKDRRDPHQSRCRACESPAGGTKSFRSDTHKECTKCHEVKPLTSFTVRSERKSGFHSHCKTCVAASLKTARSR